jgi:protocatechuate 4,5-dioxygenase beta chain
VARLRAERVDTIIIIGSDHCSLFGSECLPPCLIGTGDVRGPLEEWLGIAPRDVDNHAALARHIVDVGFASGVDWSVARNLTVDHAIMIPWHYVAAPLGDVRVIPVYLNAGVEPALRFDRAHHIGRAIGEAVRSWPGAERVAILGTGGLSHWVGMAQMGQVNADWDRAMIALMEAGDMPALLALRDEDVLAQAGNGALEIKNHICAMAAMPDARARLIAYEPVPEWVCGCAFLELERS